MKIYLNLLAIIFLTVFLSGCLTFGEKEYKFDYESGLFEVVYHDIQAAPESKDDKDYVSKDWKALKEDVARKDVYNSDQKPDYRVYDPDVATIGSKTIYREGNVLSGKIVYKVQCPKCFPSKIAVLEFLSDFGDDAVWKEINGEILLVLPSEMPVASTNGTLLHTKKNNIIEWSVNDKNFEFSLLRKMEKDEIKGVSLLSKYLNK